MAFLTGCTEASGIVCCRENNFFGETEMAAKYWIKLYLDMLDDPAVGRLSDALYRTLLQCMLAAGEAGKDGILPAVENLAWRLRMKPHVLARRLEALGEAGLLEKNADGNWLVAGFKERQGPSKDALRMRRNREHFANNSAEAFANSSRNVRVDTEPDAEAEQKEESDADADADTDSGSGIREKDILVKTFLEETGIPLNTGGQAKWRDALGRMKRAGVTQEDMLAALAECRAKRLVIANLGSIANPAIIAMSRRKARGRPSPEEDYRRYLEGEYGDVGLG